jgi:phosphoribosylanthranilate isomerase
MGGTGTIFDWQQIAELQNVIHEFPMIVAGGLTPDNVTELISKYRPFAVDVSSGIEDNGQKDPRKMREFAAKVREGDDESESSGTIW